MQKVSENIQQPTKKSESRTVRKNIQQPTRNNQCRRLRGISNKEQGSQNEETLRRISNKKQGVSKSEPSDHNWVFLVECSLFFLSPLKQIWSPFRRPLHRFILPPFFHFFRIAAEKNIRNLPAAEICRPRVYRRG
jgi:hypothetical protein